MEVFFYKTFQKRNNSTKRPSIDKTESPLPFTIHDCKLKANCSEHDPVFILSTNEFGYIYAYASDWHKFYYTVDVISLANNLVEYHMSEDLLASYRTNIYNTKARIMYSSTNYDNMIIDSRIQVKSSRQISTKVPNPNNAVFSSASGWYVLSVLSTVHEADMTGGGFAANYLVSPAAIDKVRRLFCNDTFLTQLFQYYHGSPLDNVFKCIWVPYDFDTQQMTISGQTTIIIGNISSSDFGVTFAAGELGLIYGHPFQRMSLAIDLGRRYTDFRRSEPYTTGQLWLPGVGLIDVCYGDFKGATGITVLVTIEVLTGNVSYDIGVGGDIVQHVSTNVAALAPIGSQQMNVGGFMNGIASLITGGSSLAAGAGMLGGMGVGMAGIGAVVGVANTVLNAHKHTQTVSGCVGNHMAANGVYVYLQEYTLDTESPNDSDYIALQGRPFDGVSLIADLVPEPPDPVVPIYVQCIDARVTPSILDADFNTNTRPTIREQSEINDFLNSGIYVE